MRNNVQLFPTVSLVFRAASDKIWPLIALIMTLFGFGQLVNWYFDGNAFLAHAHATSVLLTSENQFCTFFDVTRWINTLCTFYKQFAALTWALT